MRRSSTTVSPPTTVLPRRYGEKLLQNSSDSTRPRAPGDHQDDPDGVDAESRGADVHREGQDGAHHQQKDADSKAQVPRLLNHASTVGRSPAPVVLGLPSKTLSPWLLLRFSAWQAASRARYGWIAPGRSDSVPPKVPVDPR
jgi:hypothetical protein